MDQKLKITASREVGRGFLSSNSSLLEGGGFTEFRGILSRSSFSDFSLSINNFLSL
ncbi:hypothetical protein CCACVL1_28245 [Corchorus capsularis]|uniref:Uncharacterized protein n=1 Tax=Corchorus capsularis TaxID=210143 RepID=A0A1R3G775_COCAP|nr:hypothetical protein CCACVL1_28245 [Corchorus capsularis]